MQPTDFSDQKNGNVLRFGTGAAGYWAFVPNPLPPAVRPTWELTALLSEADRALSELAGLARNLPNPYLLIRPFMRREAVLSSRIEGTQTSLSDLLFHEAAAKPLAAPPDDVREVWNYVEAMEYGLERLKALPVSLRWIKELHERLMRGARGENLTPGEFRRSQNWIGPPGCTLMQATFVPPPPAEMDEALGQLERFLHENASFPPLVRMAMVHYQFEAIHPFQDGNGRVGRLLIALLLCQEKILPQPLLYLSAFFERRREEYYGLLLSVSQKGDWNSWLRFFLTGVTDQSRDAEIRANQILATWHDLRKRMESPRSSALLLSLVDGLFELPVTTIARAAKRLGVTQRAASLNIQKLVDAKILQETTGRQRNRVFICPRIIAIAEADRATASPAAD